MTNSEKYLKDGTDIQEFVKEFIHYYHTNIYTLDDSLSKFFKVKIRPTLTEDERVILRNIPKEYTKIRRNDWAEIEFVKDNCAYRQCYLLSHLFQFIKNGEEYSIEELLDEQDTKN